MSGELATGWASKTGSLEEKVGREEREEDGAQCEESSGGREENGEGGRGRDEQGWADGHSL